MCGQRRDLHGAPNPPDDPLGCEAVKAPEFFSRGEQDALSDEADYWEGRLKGDV